MSLYNPDQSESFFIIARPGYEHRAELLSADLNFPLLPFGDIEGIDSGLSLVVGEQGLSLLQLGPTAPGAVRCDFVTGATRHRRLYGGGKGQDIAKAVGLNHKGFKPVILDLTAGLGRDSFVLASLGATLQMVERHPVVAALLESGLHQARQSSMEDPELASVVARMCLVEQEAQCYLENLAEADLPDVIYLDPMFPPREKSGKVKKEMQLLHQLLGKEEDDNERLLSLSLQRANYRVVVKRPTHAPCLKGPEPGYSLRGKSTRFDVYPLQKLP